MSTIPTCAVRSTFRDSVGGEPIANATITARLSSYEIYEGFVVPRDVVAKSDENGEFVLDLFPNELGAVSSFYEIKLIAPTGKTLRTTAVVPNLTTVDLADISDVPPYDGKLNISISDVNAAVLATSEYKDIAAAASEAAVGAAVATGEDRTVASQARVDAQAARDQAVPAAATATEKAEISIEKAAVAVESASTAQGAAVTATAAEGTAVAAKDDAQAARDEAALSQDAADGSATAALTAKANAETAANVANAGAAAVLASGKTFTTTALGIAATTNGQMFLVKTANPMRYDIYTNIAGVATAGGVYEAASAISVANLAALVSLGEPAKANIVEYTDANDSIVAAISADADLLLPGAPEGVVAKINTVDERTPQYGLALLDDDLDAYADAQGGIYRRTSKDGSLYIPGLDGLSVQDAIKGGSQADVDFSLASTRTFRHTFSVEAAAVLATRAESGTGKFAPAPMNLLPGAFHISADVTNAFTVAQPARTPIDTPYFTDDGVVHPNLIEFYNGYRGYRYWAMINPYRNTNSLYENPVAFGTNDFTKFDLIPGIPAPLAPFEPPGNYNADNGFAYNPLTGELIVFWIQFQAPNSTIGRYRTTRDGINFGPRGDFFPLTNLTDESMVSPALLYNPKTGYWHLYTQAVTGAYTDVPRKLRVRRSRYFNGPWSAPIEIDTPVEARPWHQEVKYIGDKFFILCANAPIGNLFLGQSDDGINFTFGTTPILTGNLPCYKGSFVPVFQGEQMALRLVWTSAGGHPTNPSLGWDLYTAQTNFVTIG